MLVLEILPNTISTVIGGLILTIIIFFVKEKLFSLPLIMGHWIFEIKYLETEYKKYKNMILKYKILLVQKGKELSGTGEKIEEIINDYIKEYTGKDRVRIELEGYINKNYFAKSKVTLHIIEKGKERESSTIYQLKFKRKKLIGNFISTIANSKGNVVGQKS